MFQFNCKLWKQINECRMISPLSVTQADVHMIRTDTDVAVPKKPIFKKRLWHIQSSPKYKLYDKLSNWHPKIKPIININSQKILDTEITHSDSITKTRYITREPNYQLSKHLIFLRDKKEIRLRQNDIVKWD